MNSGLDFPSVLVAARTGAEWAWTKLYRDLAPSLLRYFRCYSADQAEDLLGGVFLQVVCDLPAGSTAPGEVEGDVLARLSERRVRTVLARLTPARGRRPHPGGGDQGREGSGLLQEPPDHHDHHPVDDSRVDDHHTVAESRAANPGRGPRWAPSA